MSMFFLQVTQVCGRQLVKSYLPPWTSTFIANLKIRWKWVIEVNRVLLIVFNIQEDLLQHDDRLGSRGQLFRPFWHFISTSLGEEIFTERIDTYKTWPWIDIFKVIETRVWLKISDWSYPVCVKNPPRLRLFLWCTMPNSNSSNGKKNMIHRIAYIEAWTPPGFFSSLRFSWQWPLLSFVKCPSRNHTT